MPVLPGPSFSLPFFFFPAWKKKITMQRTTINGYRPVEECYGVDTVYPSDMKVTRRRWLSWWAEECSHSSRWFLPPLWLGLISLYLTIYEAWLTNTGRFRLVSHTKLCYKIWFIVMRGGEGECSLVVALTGPTQTNLQYHHRAECSLTICHTSMPSERNCVRRFFLKIVPCHQSFYFHPLWALKTTQVLRAPDWWTSSTTLWLGPQTDPTENHYKIFQVQELLQLAECILAVPNVALKLWFI